MGGGSGQLQLLDDKGQPLGSPVSAMVRSEGRFARMRARVDPYLAPGRYAARLTSDANLIPFDMGAHPGLNGQYAILEFPDAADSSVVYIEGVTSDLYLEKANDVQKYSVMYEHLRAQALNVDQSRQFIADIAKEYAR